MLSLEAERIVGFRGGDFPAIAAANHGEYLFPSSVGLLCANTEPNVEPKLWTCGDGLHQISSLAFNPARNTIVVAERRLKVALIVFSYPQRRQLQRIADVARVAVADMTFSRDGAHFVVLSDAPQCTVSVFQVDQSSQKLTLSVQTTKAHSHLFRQISFNPRDSQVICASGSGHVCFWAQDAVTKALIATEGRVTASHVRLTSHAWLPTGQAVCGTTQGEVFLFAPEDGVGKLAMQLPKSSEAAVAVSAINVTKHHVVLGCSDGSLMFADHDLDSVHFAVRTSITSVRRVVFLPEWHSCLVCDESSIGLVHMPGYEDPRRQLDDFRRQSSKVATLQSGCRGDAVGVCHHKGSLVSVVSKDGLLTVYDYAKNAVTNLIHVGEQPALVRRFGDSTVTVASLTGTVRCVDVHKPASTAVVVRARITEGALTILEANKGATRLMVSDGRSLVFFRRTGDSVDVEGVVRLNTTTPATAACWVEGPGAFLLAHPGGDVGFYTSPFFDENATINADGLREIASEQLFVNSWRLDFPVVSLMVTGLHDEVINVLTHSLDKESKLYLLDRTLSVDRKDRESKAIKPQITMKDHEKRGTGWAPIRSKFAISFASDGKIALRDIGAYANRLTPAVPVKEKRDPIVAITRHVSLKGGVVGLSVNDEETRMVTAGGEGQIVIWGIAKPSPLIPTSLKMPPDSTLNTEAEDTVMYGEKRRLEELEVDRIRHQEQRAAMHRAIERLRERLHTIRKENEAAAEEEKVPLQDFLVDQQKAQFEEQCALAVQEMADNEHFANLNRDYVTSIIRKECWDVMEVKLTRLRALNTPAIVTNFHQRKITTSDLSLLRKLKFLRLVEMRDSQVRGVAELMNIREPDPATTEAPPSPMPPAASTPASPVSVGQKPLEAEAQEDPSSYLYHPLTVFTRHRAIVQLTLLRGKTLSLQGSFNKLFSDLVNRKKTDLIKIEERNVRCRQVLKELDEDKTIFAPQFARDEDPKYIFDVADDEVPADKSTDPDEKKRVAAELEERRRWIERHGNDDSAEKALKSWMDGRLEKEVRTLEIKVDKPEFADDTSEKYVIPEERSEDQQRIYRDYEKALAKRIEEVAARRAALQAEFAQLQKENLDQAKKFDVQVTELFQKRLIFAQQCHEVELSQVKLAQCVTLQAERKKLAKKMEAHRQTISEQHSRAIRLTQAARNKAQNIQQKLEQLREDEKVREKNLRSSHPFSDPEWGEALVRIFTKKRPKKPENRSTKKDEDRRKDDHTSLGSDAASMDPFAFIDEEAHIKAKRFMDDPQFQLPRLDQGEIPSHIWDAFQKYRQDRVNAEREQAILSEDAAEAQREVETLEDSEAQLAQQERDAFEQFEAFQRDALKEQYDVDELYTFRQGQVEVEQAPVVTDYADAILINASQIHRLNQLILASGAEKVSLMRDINEKKKDIRMVEWDMEHLSYNMASLEMELRHLHTLRVTKQMQEYINGGGDDHNEKERLKLSRHIEHVQTTMSQKIEERRQQILRLKRSIKDKELENMLLLEQVAESKSLVDERKAIRELQSSELDAERNNKLMKDMRVTRTLEDVAKAQQEEMLMAKKEIDRLRERTFPSFAVVSKRVVGNPDQK